VADLIAAFKGFDVPGEGDEVTPVRVFMEAVRCGLDIVTGEGIGESFEPFGDLAGGSGAGDGLGGGNGGGSEGTAGRLDGWVGCDLFFWGMIPKNENNAPGLYLGEMDLVPGGKLGHPSSPLNPPCT